MVRERGRNMYVWSEREGGIRMVRERLFINTEFNLMYI